MQIVIKGTIKPDWVDYNGHMGDYAYTIVFTEAVDAFMNEAGLDAGHRHATGCTLRMSALRIAFLRELHEGDSFDVRLRIVERQAQSLRLFGQMIDAGSGQDAALSDLVLIYAPAADDGIACAHDFPEAIRIKLDQIHQSDRDAPPSPWLLSRIGIRRKA